ncbi:MAG: hypothetical protein AB7P16_24930 [Bradyrhizobium sp.]|uniref:hypothetical protein n=1 Tax=Bradyrhizobium sp. TaxID=376 RepID=UPI003D0DDB64
MNGSRDEAVQAPEDQQQVRVSCANCMWLANIQANGWGECWRHPPSIVVLMSQRADVSSAKMGVVQQPTKIRPTMTPGEYCADWRMCPPNFSRPTVESGPH